MGARRLWMMLLGLGVPVLLLTADPTLLGDAGRVLRVTVLAVVCGAAVWGARHRVASRPVVGWLIAGVVLANAVNSLLPTRTLTLILLGFACGLGAIGVILSTRRAHLQPSSVVDAAVATLAPFLVVVIASRTRPLPDDAPAVLVANIVVLLLVAFTVSLPYRVPVALTFGLAAIALSTVADIAALMHTPVTTGVATFLLDLPLLLLAVSVLHPTFATVTTPTEVDDQRHRVVRVLLLSGSLAITVGLTFTDGGFLASYGAALAIAPLALVTLIALRMVQWISDLDRSATAAREQAESDPLTGLRSIQGLRVFVAATLDRTDRAAGWSAVAFDLDGFRRINDAFGMAVGDAVLQAVARTLRTVTPPDGVTARLGADEFAIMLPGTDPLRIRSTAMAGVAALRELVDGGTSTGRWSLPASAGTAVVEGEEDVVDRLIGQALTAVGDVQRRGRERVAQFQPTMAASASADLVVLQDLQRALRADVPEIEPAFQPIVDLRTGRIVAVEALARWTTPDGRWVSPDRYLALAEASGWIGQLGRLMLRRSCEALVRMREQHPLMRVHVNVSPVEAAQPSFVTRTLHTVRQTGLPLDAVVLEVTEQVLLPEAGAAMGAFLALVEEGMSLALDDFGSGYASVGYLTRLQLDYIKIDRRFVAELGDDETLLDDLLPFLAARGATVIAEGVESPEHLDRLRSLGCPLGQGYLLGRPGPVEDLLTLTVGRGLGVAGTEPGPPH